jgi:hypothetical protein
MQVKDPRTPIIKEAIQDLDGWSKPFLGRDQSGKKWLVKAVPVEPSGRQKQRALVAEYLVSRMAASMKLRWPRATIAEVEPDLCQKRNLEPLCLAFEYLPLKPLPDDSLRGNGSESQPGERLIRQLENQFEKIGNKDQLAGLAVFANWAQAYDIKTDWVQLDDDGRFVFLDGGQYLGVSLGEGYDRPEPGSRRGRDAFTHDLFRGLLKEPMSLFQPWLNRLSGLESSFKIALKDIPELWLGDDDWAKRIAPLFDDIEIADYKKEFEAAVTFWLPLDVPRN